MFERRSHRLPLVERWTPLDKQPPEERQPLCSRCELGKGAATVCMPGDGPAGGLLVVGGSPGMGDDAAGQAFATETGRYLRRLVEKWWPGPARYAYGVSCRGGLKLSDSSFAACAPYLAGEMDAGYERVLLVGADAARAVLGYRLQPVAVRRAWGYVRGLPCFLAPHPQGAVRNRFVRQWMEADVRWALQGPLPPPPTGETIVHWDPMEAVAYLTSLQEGVPVSLDIENVGDEFKATWRLLCIGMATSDVEAHVLPAQALESPMVRQAFARFLTNPAIPKGGQFIKYDINGLYREFGVEIAGLDYDTGLKQRLVEADSPAGLRALAYKVGYGGYKQMTEAQMGEDADKSEAYGKLEADQLHGYNGRDVVVTHKFEQLLNKPGRFEPFKQVWGRIVKPAIMALAQVERWGALLDQKAVADYDAWLLQRQTALDAQLRAFPKVPPKFNPNSDAQVRDLLFNVLGLRSALKTKGGKQSTSKKALAPLMNRHPLVPVLAEINKVEKQRNTYGLSMLEHLGLDGRIHTKFGIVKSGRLSSSDPNLQNLTSKGEEGKRLRKCFVASPGHLLVSLDYSQIELRILADLSGDEAMLEAFERGGDFHTETAAVIAMMQKGTTREQFLEAYGDGTSGEQWAIDMRKGAKITNFSLVFGKGDKGLAEDLTTEIKRQVTVAEAREVRGFVLGAYPKMAAWQQREIARAQLTGETWTDYDGCRRRRSLWRLGEPEGSEDAPDRDPRNVARNHPIQGTASEYTLCTLVEVVQRQQEGELPGKLVLTIHDENVSEVPEDLVVPYAKTVKGIMVSWPTKRVGLKVDCEYGPSLGEMKKLAA